MLDPIVLAALINAGAKVGTTIFQKWGGPSDVSTRAEKFVESEYHNLRALLSDHCVAILKGMEPGQNRTPIQIKQMLYPSLLLGDPGKESSFEAEFAYRLRFMEVVGVLTCPTSEYFITNVGMAFLLSRAKNANHIRLA